MAVVGAIAERVQGIIPVTWDALSKDARYGESLLRATIDTTKEKVMGVNVPPTSEVNYSVIVVDYLAKLTALELINPGIEFWMNEPSSETATGTSEQHSFLDRVAALEKLRAALIADTRKMADQVAPLIDNQPILKAPGAAINPLNEDFPTPSPLEFPRPFAVTNRT